MAGIGGGRAGSALRHHKDNKTTCYLDNKIITCICPRNPGRVAPLVRSTVFPIGAKCYMPAALPGQRLEVMFIQVGIGGGDQFC